MDSDPGPESPALAAALQPLTDIEKQLRHDNSEFCEEVSKHLGSFADAVKELENVRRTTRELLEMETIETSKLRYQILHLPGIIAQEIEAAVSSARTSNESELMQLQNELQDITLEIENTAKRQMDLEEMNLCLSCREKTLSDDYQQAVDLLNQQMAEKASKSIYLNETHNKRKKAQEAVVEFKTKIEDLAEDMIKERWRFAEEKINLTNEITETRRLTEAQEAQNIEQKKRLSQTKSAFYGVEQKLKMEREDLNTVKGDILLFQASHARLANKLEVQRISFAELFDKKDALENQMIKLKRDFSRDSNILNEKISQLDEEMNTAEMLHQTLTDKNQELWKEYQAIKESEEKELAKKKDTARQLETSRMGVNKNMEIYGKLKTELKEMELESTNLAEVSRISTEQLARQVDEFKETLEIEKQKRMANQIKKDQVLKELELKKLAEETFISEMKERIENGQKLQLSLLDEGNILQREIENFDEQIFILKEEGVKMNEDFSNMEQSLTKEIEMLEEEVSSMNRLLGSKTEELSAKIAVLDEVEDRHNKQQQIYEDLKKKAGLLKSQKRSIESSINTFSKDIETNLQKKESKKNSLKNLRKSMFEILQNELENIRLIEKDIYEINRKMEIVNMENCRLKLRNAQFKEDIDKSVNEGRNHASAITQMESGLASLLQHLKEGWEKDNFVCNDFLERDQCILDAIAELMKKLNIRKVKLGHLSGMLQKEYIGIASLLKSKSVKAESYIALNRNR
ncbi:Hypothetical predicted protein [Pelobates cultripes]|uniref:Coiled-coil domain-containing protein 175 n=2 Tax=Pelobates cultripes TaxID=61616 RepID=A0AAD1TNK0_PELCU|nr:Hypothetical predicted protein [Pelobates cultripes]